MKAEELQEWLLSEGVKQDLDRISKKIVSLEFGENMEPADSDNEIVDWSRLLLAGSILARSSIRKMEEAALRIGTAAVLIGEEQSVRDAGAVLLEKLSNTRAVNLASERNLIAPGLTSRLGVTARIEAATRHFSNSVLEKFSGKWLQVNQFQGDFWKAATDTDGWVSASAPTASGKTYLVRHWLLDALLSADAHVAVYIAPTRALVSEIELSFKELVASLGVADTIEVVSLPLRDRYEAAHAGDKKVLFVFTQERLHLLVNVVRAHVHIDLLVVDEAHKIGDGGRGVILQAAIERVAEFNPKMRAVFISPATQNPEVLLQDAPKDATRSAVNSDLPTVLQNIIYCKQVPGRSQDWELRLRMGTSLIPVGQLRLEHRPTNIRKRIALIAAAVGERGGTLIYANGAAEAEQIALLISQASQAVQSHDHELANLSELARKGVHPSYLLSSVVEKGVAFHYGNMPSLLRLEIERLFRVGKIRYLVCTSTLVEGVNLSCRTIVVRGPRKGKGNPMEGPDFWNLAGRAGRWGNEFQGNIVCIDPHDQKAWPSGVPERIRYPIKRETDEVMHRDFKLDEYIRSRLDDGASINGDLEQVAAYLLAVFIRDGSIIEAPFAKRHDRDYIRRLNDSLEVVAETIEIPSDLVARHPGVSAIGLQSLLSKFQASSGREETLIPEPPESDTAYARLCEIMRIVNESLYPAFIPEGRIPLYALIVIEWVRGYSLSYMIRKRLDYHRRHGHSVKLGDVIRSTMELVEQMARFKAPKYLAAYMDVLRFHLQKEDKSDLLDEGIDIGLALEFGVSTRTLLSLMELGLSRMTAVALNELIANDNLSQKDCISWIISNGDVLRGSDLANLVLRELLELPEIIAVGGSAFRYAIAGEREI